jgi:serine/threonine protein kinase
MSSPKTHVNDSIQAVDDNTWLLGERLLLSRQPKSPQFPHHASWDDGSGGFFVLSDAPTPLPDHYLHPEQSAILPRVYAAGDQSAVWSAGGAFIKARDRRLPHVTPEHATLQFLHSQKEPLDCRLPTVLYHGEWDGRYYLIVSRVPGVTLTEAWSTMSEELRQYYVERVAGLCETMTGWKGEAVCGVDGGQVMELYLANDDKCLEPEVLRKNCLGMGMDVSDLVFSHCDLGPGNILVEPETRGLGVIDWEIAGYVPREWVRTKFHLSSGMDFPNDDNEETKSDWRRFVARKLAAKGFTEVINGWLAFQ